MATFLNNVLKLVSGNVIAQVLGVLLVPIITRLYTPDDFGIFQIFTSISGIIAVISCFSYQFSIMLPKKDEDSANIVVLCIALTTATSIISGIILIFFGNDIVQILKVPQISNYLLLLPVVVFLNSFLYVMNYWLSRRLMFGVVAYSSVFNTAFTKLIQIGAGSLGSSPFGLIFGLIGGYAIPNILILKHITRDIVFFRQVSIKNMKELSFRYKDFPLFSSWSAVANAISIQVPSFMLAFFYSTTVVGHYSLANMAVNLPMGIVGSAIGQVFFQEASEIKNQHGSIKNLVSNVYKKLVSIGMFPMMVLMILSNEIFSFVFGAEWNIAGTYTKILIPWLFLVFISSPLSTLFNVQEKQRMGLSFNLTLLVSRIAALYIGGIYGSPIFALILFSITGVIFWSLMNLYLLRISEVKPKETFWIFLKYVSLSFLIALPIIILKYLLFSEYILFIAAAITALLYYFIIIYEDVNLRRKLYNQFK